jgi:TorA maturation chaperone TorD
MFVYSLAGLTIEGQDSQEAVELPDNATTSRTGVYQLLAQLVGVPDKDVYATAVAGEWPSRLAEAGKLVPFPVDYGSATIPASMTAEEFQAEYLRVFEVGQGTGGPPAPLYGGFYGTGGNRIQRLEEVVRFYEYFGLRASPEDPRPADNLSTELEFMKYLTKEAVTSRHGSRPRFRRCAATSLNGS